MAIKDDLWLGILHHVTIVTITLSDPDTARDTAYTTDPGASPVLRFCDGDKPYTYDSQVYWPRVLQWRGRQAVTAFTSSLGDSDGDLLLSVARIPWQKVGAAAPQETAEYAVKLPQIMRSYIVQGAPVVVTVVAERAGGQTVQQVFQGQVSDVTIDETAMHVTVIEDKEYNRLKPDTDGPADGSSSTRMIVNTTDYPNALPSEIGKSIPMIYTAHTPVSNEVAGGLCTSPLYIKNMWPCVVKDTLYNATDKRVGSIAVAGFPSQVAPSGGELDYMYLHVPSLNTVAVLNPNGGTYGQVDGYHTDYWLKTYTDADTTATIYLNPTQVVAASAGVTDPGKAFDGRSTTYASLVNTGSDVTLDLRIPYPTPQGRITAIKAFICLAAGTGAGAGPTTVNGDFGMWNAGAGPAAYHFSRSMNLTKTNATSGGYINGTAFATSEFEGYAFGDWKWEGQAAGGTRQDIYFRVKNSLNGATINVISCGLKITYLPTNLQYSPVRYHYVTGSDVTGRRNSVSGHYKVLKNIDDAVNPNVQSQFYCAGNQIIRDTSGGDVTGANGNPIYRLPEVFQHFYWKVCSMGTGSATDFTSSGFGAFSTAADDLDIKPNGGDWFGIYRILRPESPDDMRARMAKQAPLTIYRSMLDGKWRAVVYKTTPATGTYYKDPGGNDYKWKYTTDMLAGTVGVSFTPLDECVNEVHVKFGMWAPTGEYTGDAWVGPSGSDNGNGTADATRQALAVDSRDDYNVKGVLTVEADYITYYDVATALRDYLFDRYRRPRLVVKFRTGPKGIAIEPGMATLIDNELQDYIPVPWYPGSGSAKEWDDIKFFVRSNELVSGSEAGGMPFMCDITLEEIA